MNQLVYLDHVEQFRIIVSLTIPILWNHKDGITIIKQTFFIMTKEQTILHQEPAADTSVVSVLFITCPVCICARTHARAQTHNTHEHTTLEI